MNRRALTDIAPEIFRKRLLIEGFFQVDVTEQTSASSFSSASTKQRFSEDDFRVGQLQVSSGPVASFE
jgi:hypothetical protein